MTETTVATVGFLVLSFIEGFNGRSCLPHQAHPYFRWCRPGLLSRNSAFTASGLRLLTWLPRWIRFGLRNRHSGNRDQSPCTTIPSANSDISASGERCSVGPDVLTV